MDSNLLCISVVNDHVRVQTFENGEWTLHIAVPYEEGEHEFDLNGQDCKLSIYNNGMFMKVSLLDYTPLVS